MNELERHSGLVMMDVTEARRYAEAIRGNLQSAGRMLLELYEREGWKALGYDSWRACAVAEFRQGQAYLYRQMRAAEVTRQLSPIGETVINEAQARELGRLPDAEARAEVWAEVQATHPEKITAADVREAVNRHPSAPAPRPQPVRVVPEPAADFPDVEAGPQWQCAGCNRWYADDVTDCPECQPAFWPDAEAPARPTGPIVTAPPTPTAPEPFELPPAHLSAEAKAFYKIAGCVSLANLDPETVAAAPSAPLVGPSITELSGLADWVARVVIALRARQERPDLRAMK